jgi:DNA-binding response OmpR family regulator
LPRVLIVDDEPDILLMLRVALEAKGHDIALAADGDSAVRRVARESFDLMLLDVMMPVMDGWGVLEALQNVHDAPRVIVVSARTMSADVARAVNLGAADYVVKPFSLPALVARVSEVASWSDDEVEANRKRLVNGGPSRSS